MLLKLTEERDLTGGYEREVVDMLIEFLNSFEGRNPNLVSKDSLIREFIGEKI